MKKHRAAAQLERSRQHALRHGGDLLHALGCLECGLRPEALLTLSALGWNERTFTEAYFEFLMGVKLGG